MVQNGRYFAVYFEIIIFSALRPMNPGFIGFLMMQDLNLNIGNMSHDPKRLKMAASSYLKFDSPLSPFSVIIKTIVELDTVGYVVWCKA